MNSFAAPILVFLISTFFIFPVEAQDSIPENTSGGMVVSSSQDRDIAKLIVESRDYDYHETTWGKFTKSDAESIRAKSPEVLIIIGGTLAVPDSVEDIGIKSYRLEGADRIETTRLVLKEFFNFSAKRSHIIPSSTAVSSFLRGGQEKTAYLYPGESPVSKRWGLYYGEKLKPFFKRVCLREAGAASDDCNGEKSPGNEVHIGIGNTDNNVFVGANWEITELPEEVSKFPLIFLSGDDTKPAIFFITGTDQNIFFTQRSMEEMNIVKHDPRGLFVFGIFAVIVLALIGLLWRKNQIESSYAIFLIVSFSALALFYILTVLDASRLHWDSLYVYFDGALSLYFLGLFDSILDVRNLPGMSLLTYMFFLATGPTDTNAYYLQGIFFSMMLVSVSLTSYRLYGRNAGIVSFVLMASNPYLWDQRELFGSDIPFAALLSMLVFVLFFFNNPKIRNNAYSGAVFILFCLLILLRHSGLLLFIAILINTHLLKKEKIAASRPFIIAIICAFGIHYIATGNFASYMPSYFDEFKVRTGLDFSYYIYNFILTTKHSAILVNYIVAALLIYRLSLVLKVDKLRKGINRYEGVLLIFSLLHILTISLWPVPEWRYAIPIIPMLTIYVSGVVSERNVKSRNSNILIILAAIAAGLNIYHLVEGIRLI
jgi:hypothetical protein